MTTETWITVSPESVRKMLSEWMAERQRAEADASPQRVATDRARTYLKTPGDYAAELTPYLFSLLKKHAEVSP